MIRRGRKLGVRYLILLSETTDHVLRDGRPCRCEKLWIGVLHVLQIGGICQVWPGIGTYMMGELGTSHIGIRCRAALTHHARVFVSSRPEEGQELKHCANC